MIWSTPRSRYSHLRSRHDQQKHITSLITRYHLAKYTATYVPTRSSLLGVAGMVIVMVVRTADLRLAGTEELLWVDLLREGAD